jgi:hypothetical protein
MYFPAPGINFEADLSLIFMGEDDELTFTKNFIIMVLGSMISIAL